MDFDTNLAMWGALVGFFLPYLTAVVNQPTWKPAQRGAVFFAFFLYYKFCDCCSRG